MKKEDPRQHNSQAGEPAVGSTDTRPQWHSAHWHARYEQLFADSFRRVYNEQRYGRAWRSATEVQELKQLFVRVMHTDPTVYGALLQLKSWDVYSYWHSFDVYVLGCLLKGRNEDFAFYKGLLLHDIGKLEIDQAILRKNTRLTTGEYARIQRHTQLGAAFVGEHVQFAGEVALELIGSHHERLDGSGYPAGKRAVDLSEAVRVAMVADVYSALTLERPYRAPLAASDAIAILLKTEVQYDADWLHRLMEGLGVYPLQARVELTDGRYATILHHNRSCPHLPLVQIDGRGKALELPRRGELAVKRLVGYSTDRTSGPTAWDRYVAALLSGETEQALAALEKLSDGRRIEEVYVELIAKAMQAVRARRSAGEITVAEVQVAVMVTREVMRAIAGAYSQEQPSGRKLVLTSAGYGESLHMHMLGDMLRANGWTVYTVAEPVPADDLLAFMDKHAIRSAAIFARKKADIPRLRKAVQELKRKAPAALLIVGGEALGNVRVAEADYEVRDMLRAVEELTRL
ncbi:HD domain-containing protein [Paenibacillus athensensis]|uniref:HD domain-containing phosphohydrolase n=1 Tax=Paenibacillus athensensis TaxID=1967502 RepID=UPI0014309762|nr:HD domain-containing phosphohydrolase [Paenibacillus athensensis]MCD1257408.1 HD domain-containing protein [Paenibacillus athensensis]